MPPDARTLPQVPLRRHTVAQRRRSRRPMIWVQGIALRVVGLLRPARPASHRSRLALSGNPHAKGIGQRLQQLHASWTAGLLSEAALRHLAAALSEAASGAFEQGRISERDFLCAIEDISLQSSGWHSDTTGWPR